MKRSLSGYLLAFLLTFSILTSAVVAPANAAEPKQNNYPIVLVHGFAGFDSLAGVPYWGFAYNIPKDLKSQGYIPIVASIGPFSSNWDRCCELYAQLVGGRVDYGKVHSEKYGHERYGRTYPGLYPQFGSIDPETGKRCKIHLIGHSMGGPTVRAFAALLANGSQEEREGTPADELSPLFAGNMAGLIKGVLTIASPGDGTTAVYGLAGKGDKPSFLQQFVLGLTSLAGGTAASQVYDVYLDQWGFKRQAGESLQAYLQRIESSEIWQNTHDLSVWDLKPDGARELNAWASAQPDIYYFSQGASCTRKNAITGYHVPTSKMSPIFWPTALYIGSYTQTRPFVIDKSWWENDGLVSVATADGPRAGSTDEIVIYDGEQQIGKWNYLGTLKNIDHMSMVGILSANDPRPLFRSYAELLASLPE